MDIGEQVWGKSIEDLRSWQDDSCLIRTHGLREELALWNCSIDKSDTFVGSMTRGKEPVNYRDVDTVALLDDRLYGVVNHYIPNRGSNYYFMTAKKGMALRAGGLVPQFESGGNRVFFVRIWQGKMIVCDWYRLWLLEPEPAINTREPLSTTP